MASRSSSGFGFGFLCQYSFIFFRGDIYGQELPSFLQLLRRELLEVAGNRSSGLALLACGAGAMFRDCIAEACLSWLSCSSSIR
ncbi:hypothetical protein BKA82DRAFT_205208 [Pisolithus tinctorius]|uniref:Uncharacterized protein n=1 Tax=Pisolithus tinctorius Marx 270 TaxID=870435 RepID=A0A0C3PLH4_PISTI|nr:hypothetical protein BKA82DRAFT_205208 [Pisolithus tinctorius]KIO15155.1 hypothetical protein M404DRAFT_205208 [Pisolithus tinctorius Marx 270]